MFVKYVPKINPVTAPDISKPRKYINWFIFIVLAKREHKASAGLKQFTVNKVPVNNKRIPKYKCAYPFPNKVITNTNNIVTVNSKI
jgi:hypothetical protein